MEKPQYPLLAGSTTDIGGFQNVVIFQQAHQRKAPISKGGNITSRYARGILCSILKLLQKPQYPLLADSTTDIGGFLTVVISASAQKKSPRHSSRGKTYYKTLRSVTKYITKTYYVLLF